MELKILLSNYLAESKETVDAFAARAGVSRATVFRVKNGSYGGYSRMQRILAALKTPIRASTDPAPENLENQIP
jgi:DNA-binding MurR/RpiR family transcriptional regulator